MATQEPARPAHRCAPDPGPGPVKVTPAERGQHFFGGGGFEDGNGREKWGHFLVGEGMSVGNSNALSQPCRPYTGLRFTSVRLGKCWTGWAIKIIILFKRYLS